MNRLLFAPLVFFAFLLSACNDEEAMLALNSAPIYLKYQAKDARLVGQKEPFMLFFYSKDCGACKQQIPILNELKDEFKIIGVLNGARNMSKAKEDSKGTEFATIYMRDDVEYLSNVVGGIYGVPAIFFYDADGKMVKKYISVVPKGELKRQINLIRLKDENGA